VGAIHFVGSGDVHRQAEAAQSPAENALPAENRKVSVPTFRLIRWLVPVGLVLVVVPAEAADTGLRTEAQAIFKPLPKDMVAPDSPLMPAQVKLGRMLYFETRASVDGTVSCARCHQPALFGTDALPKAIGAEHRLNPRNAPTVLNAAIQFVQHWRGDRTSVEDQATKALVALPSFGNPTYETAMTKLKAIPGYPALFAQAFPGQADPVTAHHWGQAIGAYMRTLVTPSPFDAFLAGEARALSPAAQAGLRTFIQVGCVGCHNGVGVGGAMYQKFGLVEDYWKATGSTSIDKGRFEVTHNPADMYVFKVPTLRNVAMTPPYFHDGSVATLPAAVRVMARVQLGRTLTDAEVADLVAFLASLTGQLPRDFVTAPLLPAASAWP
jgi:cytochrome c peroxidase